MRIISLFLIVFFNFILSTTWLQYASIFGIIPNTSLIILICYSLLRKETESSIFGFFVGLLQDILFGQIIGIAALLMMFVGFFSSKFFKDYYRENYIIPLIVVSIFSLLYEISFYVLNFLLLGRTNFIFYLGRIILPSVAYNLVVSIFIYKAIYELNIVLSKREERKKGFMNK